MPVDRSALYLPVVCPECGTSQIIYSKRYGPMTESYRMKTRCRQKDCKAPLDYELKLADLQRISSEFIVKRESEGHHSPNVFWESSPGTHFTDTLGTPIDFGSVQAGGSKATPVFLDNEASGGGSNNLQNLSIDGVTGSTQTGSSVDTFNAVKFGSLGYPGTWNDPWDYLTGTPLVPDLPADGDGGTRQKVFIRWLPPSTAPAGSKAWGVQVDGVFS